MSPKIPPFTPFRAFVGDMDENVVAMYREANHALKEYSGPVSYIYDFLGRPPQLVFDVKRGGRDPRAIRFCTKV